MNSGDAATRISSILVFTRRILAHGDRGGDRESGSPWALLRRSESFERRQRHGVGGRAADHPVVDHRARLAERGVIVGELQVAALARVYRRSAVVHLL